MKKRWVARPVPCIDISSVADTLSLPRSLALLLARRGYTGDSLQEYLHPDGSSVSLWSSTSGMREAAQRVVTAIESSQKIVVHGDFDADGITATALMCRALRLLEADVDFYIPDRFEDGYGVSDSSVEACISMQADLMITVDCGIGAAIEVEKLKSAGIDSVITDHHQPGEILPAAVAVVDPALDMEDGTACPAGVGVCWMLVQGIFTLLGRESELPISLMQLVGIGTIADIVELTGDNRILAFMGIRELRNNPLPGISALAAAASVNIQSCSSQDIAFYLGPRLNASGRVGHASESVNLLLTDDPELAAQLAKRVESSNRKRKVLEQDVAEKADLEVRKLTDQRCIVVSGENWHQGVIGIVASRLAASCGVPALLIAVTEGTGRGSARSLPGIPIYSLLETVQEEAGILSSFGGHPMAAGFSLQEENIPVLREHLSRHLSHEKWDKHMGSVVYLDGNLEEQDYSISMVKALEALEPFGQGNRMPVWLARGVYAITWKAVGKKKNHLQCVFQIGSGNFRAIGFDMVDRQSLFSGRVDLAFTLSADSWRNDGSVQLILKDIRRERMPQQR